MYKKILRQQARCAVYLVKKYLGYLRLGAANYKAYKAKVSKAEAFREKKLHKYKRILFKSI